MIVLAILIPPLAVLMATHNPIRALIAGLLWLLGWIPGSIYAVMAVNEAKHGKMIRQSEARIINSGR
jgi:uncharacterized membrane protein YqaE (UPF0057 family)